MQWSLSYIMYRENYLNLWIDTLCFEDAGVWKIVRSILDNQFLGMWHENGGVASAYRERLSRDDDEQR